MSAVNISKWIIKRDIDLTERLLSNRLISKSAAGKIKNNLQNEMTKIIWSDAATATEKLGKALNEFSNQIINKK